MTVQKIEEFLLWCAVMNYCLLLLWWALFTFAHDATNRLLVRLSPLSAEEMDRAQFLAIVLYKLAIVFLNLIPYVALRVIAR